MWGSCAAEVTVSWRSLGSHSASTPLPSIGAMHWRAVRTSRVTLTAARAATASMSSSISVSRKTLSPHCSWISGASASRAASMSETAGNISKSTATRSAMSSASARVSATQTAIVSPTWRTFSAASAGWADGLNPGSAETARIGLTPSMSAWMKTRGRMSSGMSIAPIRACATGLRTNAASSCPARPKSPTKRPRPRIRRSSSLRAMDAPTP